jgi:glycosyltransferase involved in cell wall biosynthesis
VPLSVLSIAYALAPVSRDTAGGAEQILWALDQAIVRAGHTSVVVAQEGSAIAGHLVATPAPRGTITEEVRGWITAAHQSNIERACREYTPDLIHFHGIDFASYRTPPHVAALATLHLPPAWYPSSIWGSSRVQLQCVSASQRRACPTTLPLPVIANGVATGALPRRPRGYALALGRVCPEKNLHAALQAGTLASIPVLLGGTVFPYQEHERYFHEAIEPLLATGRHRFLGPVGYARKRRLLAGARCLLLPTLAPETSSLVAMEALAAGTPVVAYPSGAIPEIIEDGVTGFLVHNEREMADAIHRCDTIDPDLCQSRAQTLYSVDRMTAAYLALYQDLLLRRNTRAVHAAS